MKTATRPQTRHNLKKKHLCYYGYTKVPWYEISCSVCGKIIKRNLATILLICAVLVAIFSLYVYLT